MIAAGHADALVVYKLDRVTRSTIDFADLWRTSPPSTREFVSLTEGSTRQPRWARRCCKSPWCSPSWSGQWPPTRAKMTPPLIAVTRRRAGRVRLATATARTTRRRTSLVEPGRGRLVAAYRRLVARRRVAARGRAPPRGRGCAQAGVPARRRSGGDGRRGVAVRLVASPGARPGDRRAACRPRVRGAVAGTWEPIVDPDKWHRLVGCCPIRGVGCRRTVSRRCCRGSSTAATAGAVLRHASAARTGSADALPLRPRRTRTATPAGSVDRRRRARRARHVAWCSTPPRAASCRRWATATVTTPAGCVTPSTNWRRPTGPGICRSPSGRRPAVRCWSASLPPNAPRFAVNVTMPSRRWSGPGDLRRTWDRLEVATKRAVIRQVLADVIVDPANGDRGEIAGRVRVERAD